MSYFETKTTTTVQLVTESHDWHVIRAALDGMYHANNVEQHAGQSCAAYGAFHQAARMAIRDSYRAHRDDDRMSPRVLDHIMGRVAEDGLISGAAEWGETDWSEWLSRVLSDMWSATA